ncbi:hypothetical protein K438DRAFT_1174579 [Mycena galopus ATCC 62051]|nr:hypothetical protein K438DRAFT_1174579 [Mycena galopus ATCC 62051]
MDYHDRLPYELWQEILEDVSESDPEPRRTSTLENFSLACRMFCDVSRPWRLANFRFSAYLIGTDGTLLLPSPEGIHRRLERLDFWCSPGLAPFVRSCSMYSRRRPGYGDSDPSDWSFSTQTPYILLDALFQRLGRVDILCRLPMLSAVTVGGCHAAPGERIEPSPRALSVSEFHLMHIPQPQYQKDNDYWIPLLHPDHLRSLGAYFSDIVRTVRPDHPNFPNVHRLSGAMDLPTLSENLMLMSRFPAPVFPLLEEYSGPYEILPLFLPAATLRRIRTDCDSPKDLITRIEGVQGAKITSLDVEFATIDTTAVNKLVELFPRLTELLIRIVIPDLPTMFDRVVQSPAELENDEVVDGEAGEHIRAGFTPSAFFQNLAADTPSLPLALKCLAISWDCYCADPDERSAYKVPDFPRLRDALVVRCPGLTWLWLNGYYFMFEWRGSVSSSTVKEFTARNFVDTKQQRGTEDILWGET